MLPSEISPQKLFVTNEFSGVFSVLITITMSFSFLKNGCNVFSIGVIRCFTPDDVVIKNSVPNFTSHNPVSLKEQAS